MASLTEMTSNITKIGVDRLKEIANEMLVNSDTLSAYGLTLRGMEMAMDQKRPIEERIAIAYFTGVMFK